MNLLVSVIEKQCLLKNSFQKVEQLSNNKSRGGSSHPLNYNINHDEKNILSQRASKLSFVFGLCSNLNLFII